MKKPERFIFISFTIFLAKPRNFLVRLDWCPDGFSKIPKKRKWLRIPF